MIVERKNNELLVRVKIGKNSAKVQSILDYLSYEELTSKTTANEEDIERLVGEVKRGRLKRVKKELGIND